MTHRDRSELRRLLGKVASLPGMFGTPLFSEGMIISLVVAIHCSDNKCSIDDSISVVFDAVRDMTSDIPKESNQATHLCEESAMPHRIQTYNRLIVNAKKLIDLLIDDSLINE